MVACLLVGLLALFAFPTFLWCLTYLGASAFFAS